MSDLCPKCGRNLAWSGELDFTDRVGVEYPEVYDGVLFWHCRVCDGTWNAWPEDHPRYAIAERYMAEFATRTTGSRAPYERMCVSCHRAYDAQRRAATGERTSPVRRSA